MKKAKSTKKSLISIMYLYPILAYLLGLAISFTYFSIVEVRSYNRSVEKLRKNFPLEQRNSLQQKVLIIKDYISWVQSNPASAADLYLNKKLVFASDLVIKLNPVDSTMVGAIGKQLRDSLDSYNRFNQSKIILIDSIKGVIYQPAADNEIPVVEKSKKPATPVIQSVSKTGQLMDPSKLYEPFAVPLIIANAVGKSTLMAGIILDGSPAAALQDWVLDSLSRIKFTNDEYIIVNTFDGKALLSRGTRPQKPIDIMKSGDMNWQGIFEKQIELACDSTGGFYTYFWRNKSEDKISEKTSYFSADREWKWIIGTGYFSRDIEPVIASLKQGLWNEIFNNVLRFGIFLLVIGLVGFGISRYISNQARRNVSLFINFFRRASQGMQVINTETLAFSEFETLAVAANKMILERERIKSNLSSEKSRLRYMIDAIPDMIFFKHTNSQFLGCNTAFEKYINKKSDEIIGLTEFDLFPVELAEAYVKSDKQIVDTLKPEHTTEWVNYKNGQRKLYDTLKTPYFDANGNLLGIIGISRDITEMEETRQRLIVAKEKAEESDRLKTAFLANMSHEIRTPMNAIIGFSDLLGDDDVTKADKADFIAKIKIAGRSLITLINDIIDIAKIEAGQLKIVESDVNINQLLNELYGIFAELKNTSTKNEIELKLNIPEKKSNLMLLTDRNRLQQILVNLLSNALKFTEFGTIEFGYSVDPSNITFYVKDTGIGILRSKQKLLFQRFSQLDPSATRKYGGTGLGLAISKNLADLLGGSIWMESIPGKGSTFFLSLPNRTSVVKSAPLSRSDLRSIKWPGKTILIAEDIMQNFTLMEAVLRHSEVKLVHAINGQVAIDLVQSRPEIDLVLMDIQLPIKTGYEALDEILEIRPELPVLCYTAFALPHEKEKSLAAGFVEYVPKPIKAETLIPILDKYLGKVD